MKKINLLFLLVSFTGIFAQSSKAYLKDQAPGADGTFTVVYEPAADISIPEISWVRVLHQPYTRKRVALEKTENGYEFSLKLPAETDAILFTINSKGKSIDNNHDKGYLVFVNTDKERDKYKTDLMQLDMSYAARTYLKLDIQPEEIIAAYDTIFKAQPALKESESYPNYLFIKYNQDKENTLPEFKVYLSGLVAKGDDQSLSTAYNLYSYLKMPEEAEKVKKLALEKYPDGEVAKRQFIDEFYEKKDKSEQYITDSYKEFAERFADTSAQSKDMFFGSLLYLKLKDKESMDLDTYENLIHDKMMIANMYNGYAWGLVGEDLESPGEDLDYAERLMRRALEIIRDKLAVEFSDMLQGNYNMCADTYALILYKLKRYPEAFEYQHQLAEQNQLGIVGKERYAAYAEKVKGPEFTRLYLEKQLLNGADSRLLLNQLEKIYTELKLPETDFKKIKTEFLAARNAENRKKLIEFYGDTKAMDFTLTNREGKSVTLADYKGKVVVLDFWATWCGPCRASFPHMQELVDEYKGKDVEFLFINAWEQQKPEEIKKKVGEFISENNYTFNVLFDFEDAVIAKYKVRGIPTKIVIDKNGEIISTETTDGNLKALIEENLN